MVRGVGSSFLPIFFYFFGEGLIWHMSAGPAGWRQDQNPALFAWASIFEVSLSERSQLRGRAGNSKGIKSIKPEMSADRVSIGWPSVCAVCG